jgi:ABC-type cobalamin/Fe3+-siderophores transport system ATPase subunit
MKLELKKFNPASIPSDSIIVIIGKRGVGKSVLLKDILYYHRDIPVGVVVSPTETANAYFESFVPKMLLYEEASDEILEKF